MRGTFKTEIDSDYQNQQEEEIKTTKQEGFYKANNSKNNFNNNLDKNTRTKIFFSMKNIMDDKPENIMNNFNLKELSLTNHYNENIFNFNMNKLQIKNVDEFLTLKEKTLSTSNVVFKELFEIDKKLAIIKNNMTTLKKNEMNRLMREFNLNDYERRFKTTKFTVVSALIGEENTIMEIHRQNRENKVK